MSAASSASRTGKSPLAQAVQFVRRSQSLAVMLPSLLQTGVITLVISAVMRLVWVGFDHHFFRIWMESWLTAWPITFPVAYLIGPSIVRFAARIAPAARTQTHEPAGPA